MTKKSKKRRLSKQVQKFNLTEIDDASPKVTIYTDKPKETPETANKNKENEEEEQEEKIPSPPFMFEEPEWFRHIVVTLSKHLGLIPEKVAF